MDDQRDRRQGRGVAKHHRTGVASRPAWRPALSARDQRARGGMERARVTAVRGEGMVTSG